jgi:integrase
MDEFREFLKKYRKRNGELLLESSINLYVNNIERFKHKFNSKNQDTLFASMNDILKENPIPNIKASFKLYLMFCGLERDDDRLKLLRKIDKRASALTSERELGRKLVDKEDIDLIIEEADGLIKLAIMISYDGALRRSELFSIQGRDIKFVDEGNIKAEVRILGKGAKYRKIFLKQKTVDYLKELKGDITKEEKLFTFYKPDGKTYARPSKYYYDQLVKIANKVLGIHVSPHFLRHSKLSHLVEKGGDINAVSKYANHSDLSTTNIYVKHAKGVAKRMIMEIDDD